MDEDKYRTGWKRLGAAIVDWIVFLPLALVYRWIPFDPDNPDFSIVIWVAYIQIHLPVIYSIFCHYKFGHTIGKWVVRVQVMDVSETRKLTLKQAILRDIVPLGVLLVGLLVRGYLELTSDEPQLQYNQYAEFTDNWTGYWFLLEIITMLINPKRRALHDFIAGTVVVRTDLNQKPQPGEQIVSQES